MFLPEWFWFFFFVFLVSVKCLCLLRREGNLCMLTHVFMLHFKLISHLASDINQDRKYKKGQKKTWLCGYICRTHFHVSWIPCWTWTWKSLNSQKPELSECKFLWLSSSYSKICDLFSLIIVSVVQTLTAGWPLRGSLCGVCRDLAFLKALPSLWIWVTSRRPQAQTQKMQALLSSPILLLLLGLLSPLHGLTP